MRARRRTFFQRSPKNIMTVDRRTIEAAKPTRARPKEGAGFTRVEFTTKLSFESRPPMSFAQMMSVCEAV